MNASEQQTKNRRLAWILASVALAVFVGFILKAAVLRG